MNFEVKQTQDRSVTESFYSTMAFATRDLEAGDIILEEFPIFQIPEAVDCGNKGQPHCVTCGINLFDNGNPLSMCSTCDWPVCGLQCEKAITHADYECKVFADSQFKRIDEFKLLPSFFMPNAIMIVRAMMLMKKEPEKFKILMEIPLPGGVKTDSFYIHAKNPKCQQEFFSILYRFLINYSTNKPILDDCETMVSHGIHMINLFKKQGFEMKGCQYPNVSQRQHGTYIYSNAWNFTHSCSPNCTWAIGPYPDFKVRIRAAVPIKKGDPMTVSRIMFDESGSYGAWKRQSAFFSHFGFYCNCNLCIDLTEFSTNMSAIICQTCRKSLGSEFSLPSNCDQMIYVERKCGFLLPKDSMNFDINAFWICDRCGHEISISSNYKGMDAVFEKLSELTCDGVLGFDGKTKAYCERMIKITKHAATLSPTHWLLLHTNKILNMCQYQQFGTNTLSLSKLNVFLSSNHDILSVLDVILPGLFPGKASLIFCSFSAIRYVGSDFLSEAETLDGKSVRDLVTNLKLIMARFDEARQFYAGLLPWTATEVDENGKSKSNPKDDILETMAKGIEQAQKLLGSLNIQLSAF